MCVYVCEGVGEEESAGEWGARALCVCVLCIRVHSERNKLRNLMCVCVCVRTSADTKRKYRRRHNIESTRRCGGVFVCGTPMSERRLDGKTGELRLQRKTEVSRHTSVCVSPSYIPMRAHINICVPMHTVRR